MSDDHIPKAGDLFTKEDFDILVEAMQKRMENFPDENPILTLGLVLFNIGDRYAPVICIEQEWKGLKRDIPPDEGIPKCPNGHPLIQGNSLRLGWLEEV